MSGFLEKLTRRKVVDFGHSELRRVLGIIDLTMLGVGSTIGVGIYVLAGEVSRSTSGPAVTLAFLIAAVASLFAGLCYAEFGARVPKAGSAYIYTYVCIGEFVAFIVGWNLILEYVIGTASVARGFSQYVDALANDSIENAFYEAMPLVPEDQYDSSFISPYPDFLSFGLAIVLSVTLALGVKESSTMNNIFTGINIIVIIFVIIAAGSQGNPYNWKIPENEVAEVCNVTSDSGTPEDWGTGGFVPFGFEGVMQGAATCFFGFVGFDVIATTGEEALNPQRTIPVAIGLSLFIVFLSYFGVSTVITLAVPYCLQDEDAPLVVLFDENHIGWEAAKWFVSIGALFGFSASLFGAMFPLPRVIYAMASDGLVFRTLANVSKRFQTPTLATALAGLFAGAMAMLFNLDALVDMMSIGTLMAYTIVAVCVMLLRYRPHEEDEEEGGGKAQFALSNASSYTTSDYIEQLFNTKGLRSPTDLTAALVTYGILSYCVLILVFDILLVTLSSKLAEGNGGAIAAIVIVGIINIINVVIISRQPQSKKKLSFKVPLVPWLPALSTFINLYLMCNLDGKTWIRFAVWMAIGFLDYFAYGLWHSSLSDKGKSNQGLDNLGYIDDNFRNQQLIIPTIEIQPATPLSSEPNTPVVKPKAPPPTSPLVSVEVQGNHSIPADDQSNRTHENDRVGSVSAVSAAAIVASLMTDDDRSEKDTKDPDDTDKGKDTQDMERSDVETKDEGSQSLVEKEEEKLRGSVSPDEENVEMSGSSGDGADKPLPPTFIGSSAYASDVNSTSQLPSETSATIDPADARQTEYATVEEGSKTDYDNSAEDDKPDAKAEDKEEDSSKGDSTSYKHFTPPPLILPPVDLQSDKEEDSSKEDSTSDKHFTPPPLILPPVDLQSDKEEDSSKGDSTSDKHFTPPLLNLTTVDLQSDKEEDSSKGDPINDKHFTPPPLNLPPVDLQSDKEEDSSKEDSTSDKHFTPPLLNLPPVDLRNGKEEDSSKEDSTSDKHFMPPLLNLTTVDLQSGKEEDSSKGDPISDKHFTPPPLILPPVDLQSGKEEDSSKGDSTSDKHFTPPPLNLPPVDLQSDKEDSSKGDSIRDKHFRPPPLNLPPVDLQSDKEEDSGLPRAFYSSPELSPPHSPPPSPPPSSPASSHPNMTDSSVPHPRPALTRSVSEKGGIHSVPTTPVGRRHPTKVLRRMSSFDDIPPSSPDSPFAKRVASFVVIPVREPGVGSNVSSNPATPGIESSFSQDNLSKAVDVLNKYKKDEDKKMFTVGSSDSLDSLTSDPSESVEFLSPRRGLGRELDVLDPIRERGESKIYANDTDKIEIHPSPEDTSTSVVTDTSSPNTTGSQEQEGNK